MDGYLKRKRKLSIDALSPVESQPRDDVEDTDMKLAILASLHPDLAQEILLDSLLAHDGSVDNASRALNATPSNEWPRKRSAATGYQSSLATFIQSNTEDSPEAVKTKKLTRKGQTLHLYTPRDIELHTPCSIIHNFLPAADADLLLRELLAQVPLFEKTVESPHSMGFYVDTVHEVQEQKGQYSYNGTYYSDVHQTTPEMLRVSSLVSTAVNKEIERRVEHFNPDGKRLKFQSAEPWVPNTSFVNCYDGGKQNVGYHTDDLTYLGPRAVIGSLSLGVAREFRVRKIVPSEEPDSADQQGQIAIHLPHNSLLVMHADMQEEWKHSIAPAQAIDPHPIAGNKRLNITYRCFQPYLHPRLTPKCRCDVPVILRCAQRQRASRGRYMWMCNRNYTPGEKGCGFFEWAKIDEHGKPPWAEGYKGDANLPVGVPATEAG